MTKRAQSQVVRWTTSLAAIGFVVTACGSGGSGSKGAAAPQRSDAEWKTHCEAVVKRSVSCQLIDEEVGRLELAACTKTQKCELEGGRVEAIPLRLTCEESADCDDSCDDVVGARLPPLPLEGEIASACTAKFAGCDMCKPLGATVHLGAESDGEGVKKCIAQASTCTEVGMCGLGGMGSGLRAIGCKIELAPDEMKKLLAIVPLERPLPERPKIDAFGKLFAVGLGAPAPESRRAEPPHPPAPPPKGAHGKTPSKKSSAARKPAPPPPVSEVVPGVDPFRLTYGGQELYVRFEPRPGPVDTISFGTTDERDDALERCKTLVKKVVEEYGPPSQRMLFLGSTLIWKGSESVLSIHLEKKSCGGTFAAKGSASWEQYVRKR